MKLKLMALGKSENSYFSSKKGGEQASTAPSESATEYLHPSESALAEQNQAGGHRPKKSRW